MPCRTQLFMALLIALLTGSCRSVSTEPSSPGYEYFPLETGHYVIYDITEQQYTLPATLPVQQTYQLKEVVGAAYADVTGQQAYRLVRYRRPGESQPWQPDSVWSARLGDSEGIRTENGLDVVKLRFPVSNGLRWNANQHNAAGTDEYELRNSGQPYRVLDKQFDETVTVVAQQDSTLVSQDKRIEVYAKQVGLIYKERVQLQYCSSSPTCIGKYQVDYGVRQVYRVRSSGSE